MSHWKSLAAALLAVSLPCALVQANALRFDPDVAYSAVRVIENDKTRIEQRYFHHDATTNRMESELRGQQSIMILRADRNLLWTIMPQKRMYMEMSLDTGTVPGEVAVIPERDRWVEIEELGREAVHGVSATRYRVVTDDEDGTRMQGHIWVSEHGIPVRMDLMSSNNKRTQMELRDLVVGPQPATLFEPPADYQKFAVGGGAADVLQGLKGVRVGGPGATAAPKATPSAAEVALEEREPGFVDELAVEATEEAKQATKDEVRGSVRETVKKGLRDLIRIP